MHVTRTRNVQQALPQGVHELLSRGIPTLSRNGDVLVLPDPLTTVYTNPTERVLFWPERDANPFFHFFESLWMLAGRDDLAYLTQFIKNMENYSDNGKTLNGAYGYRWRHYRGAHTEVDQLKIALNLLKSNPRTRRCVVQMWEPESDLFSDETVTKDACCNTQIYLWNLAGRLQMTVTCRSNDMVWGAYGANAVHFSMLQEYMAGMLGWEVGTLYQISNNFHAYPHSFNPIQAMREYHQPLARAAMDPYQLGAVEPYSMVTAPERWDMDLALFMEDPASNGFTNQFFSRVAKPLWWAHAAYRKGKKNQAHLKNALEIVGQCAATDWRRAAEEWLTRRLEAL